MARQTDGAANKAVRSLVVPAPGALGFLHALPIAAALAADGRAVGVAASPPESSLLALAPRGVAGVARDAGRVEAGQGWDEALVFDRSLATALRVRALGIPRRLGVAGLLRRPFLTATVASEGSAAFLAAVGVAASPPPWLVPAPDLRARALARLARAGLADHPAGLLAVAPAAPARGPAWPRSRWVDLLQRLRRHRPSLRFLLLTTTADLWTTVRIHEATARLHPVLGPDLDLPTTATVLAEVDLVLTAAAFPAELATAVGTPVVRPEASDEETAAEVERLLDRWR